ncbi:GNAT family N-acetyltransferase [Microbacterium paludicola]|uniref:GNAT family N-acetyltransferase n=1 Tax=Microbacterium paludicola TaxID=300019 RepID=UPI003879D0FE
MGRFPRRRRSGAATRGVRRLQRCRELARGAVRASRAAARIPSRGRTRRRRHGRLRPGVRGGEGAVLDRPCCRCLPPEVVSAWVGGHFELVELAVIPTHRGRGLGRRLLGELLGGIAARCLLSTVDDERDAAVRLYRSEGWDRLGSLRPGVQVMGLDLRGASARTADVRRQTDCGSGDVG